MEKPGYKQALIPEAFYNQLLARAEEAKRDPGAAARQKGTSEWCLTIVIMDGNGEQHLVCVGSCAWYKKIFGGDCVGGGGGCHCSWGILEPILGLFR
ncbi:MAG: hypothetical protein ACRDLZ_11885 [Gaiellaceae bacterium]